MINTNERLSRNIYRARLGFGLLFQYQVHFDTFIFQHKDNYIIYT
jgi:hypothetical protein